MTRASLLQLLAHPTALTGADVRTLEQLAEAFPYCQTAHLLLAKAAHDQGSMLAGQRLRRAATYAADRTRLRQLIEQQVPAELVAAEAAPLVPVAELQPSPLADAPAPPAAPTTTVPPARPFEDKPDQVIGQQPAAEVVPAPAVAEVEPAAAPEVELPVQAPPIRPPAEAAAARLEFGLAEQEPAEILAYRLPELLPADAPGPESAPAQPATSRLPAFSGVPGVGYAAAEGSRLGFCLVATATDELPPDTSLPPAGEFFAPDALLLAHLAAHQLPTPPKPSPLDLINSFLQRAPAAPRRRVAPLPSAPEPDAQADLSVRSTRTETDLASEGLAKILARQGKIERAIAVYERLMVKHPEKMAYFAAQIDSLRPLA